MEVKRQHMESEMRTEALIADALRAMQAYSGNLPEDSESNYNEYED
jgi:hypothetical protein